MIYKNNKKYLFITGHKRSGTTLLQMILSAHSKICISPETKIISDLIKNFPTQEALSQIDIKCIKNLIANDPKLKQWHFDHRRFCNEIHPEKNLNLKEIIRLLMISFCNSNKTNAEWIGNKKGFFLKEGGQKIKDLFQDAKIIIIVRDCRAVVHSVLQTFNKNNCKTICKSWEQSILRGQWLRKKFPDEVLELRYEDLTLQPENTAKKICSFLNIDYEQAMINFDKKNLRFAPGELSIHQNLFGGIDATLNTKWRNRLSESQIIEIEQHTNWKLMMEYSYAKIYTGM